MSEKVPLLSYAPDADPTTPGVITNCSALVPTLRGYAGAASPVTATPTAALASVCQGAATLLQPDGTSRTFAGTGTKLYEASPTAWLDRTRAAGGDYALGADSRWSFAQFQGVSLATSESEKLQFSSAGAFADVTGAPKAAFVETVGNFVFVAKTNEALYGVSNQRWWCAALGGYTDWTPAISTQSATGALTGIPGPITGLKRFGGQLTVHKQNGMYVGTYVGAPVIWDFQELPGQAGAQSQEAIVNVGTPDDPKLLFMGFDDFYEFSGVRAVPIGESLIKETVFAELNKQYAHVCRAVHDRIYSRVYFYYPSSGVSVPDKCVVYNYRSRKWGRDDRSVQASFEYLAPGVAYDGLGALYSTYSDFPSGSYDSSVWTNGFPLPAFFNTSNVLQTLSGPSTSSSLTTGDLGDDTRFSLIRRAVPRFSVAPTSASVVNFYRNNLNTAVVQDATSALSSTGRADFLREARWHRLRMDFTGPVETTGVVVDVAEAGDE